MKHKLVLAAFVLSALSVTLPAFAEGEGNEVGVLSGNAVEILHIEPSGPIYQDPEAPASDSILPESEQPQVENDMGADPE